MEAGLFAKAATQFPGCPFANPPPYLLYVYLPPSASSTPPMMDNLSGITAFIQVAETRSFTEAGRLLEISSSAVGKSVARMEERLGVRLFHRSTRSVTLTIEGELFLDRCKRILSEVEAAQMELLELSATPRGKVRISVPLQNVLIMPVLAGFI